MSVVRRFGTLIALVGFALVGLGTYAVLGGSGYGIALSLMIPGLFVIIAGMLVVSVAGATLGLDSVP